MKVSYRTVCSGVMLFSLLWWVCEECWAQPQYSVSFSTTVTPSSIPFANQSLVRVRWEFYLSDSGTLCNLYGIRFNSSLVQVGLHISAHLSQVGQTDILELNEIKKRLELAKMLI